MLANSQPLLSLEAQSLQIKVHRTLLKEASSLYAKNPASSKTKLIGKSVQELEACTDSHPCYNAACQRCLRITSQLLRKAAINCVTELKLGSAYQVTYINPEWAKPIGSLSTFDLDVACAELSKSLAAKLPVNCLAMGGFDISHNLQLTSGDWLKHQKWADHYQPHFQVLVWGASYQVLKDALPPVKGKLVTGSLPVKIERVRQGDLDKAISYALKNNFFRRVSCPNPHRSLPLVKSLRGEAFREIWSWLASKKTKDLLVLKGIYAHSFCGINLSFQ